MKKLLILKILLLFASTIFYPICGYTQDTPQYLPQGAKLVININTDAKVRVQRDRSHSDQSRIILDWDISSDRSNGMFIEFPLAVHNVLFSQDGETLACTSNWAPIHLWNASSGKYKHTLPKYTADVKNVEKESSWLSNTQIPLHVIPFGTNIAFSPNGEQFANGSKDKTIHVWNTAKGQPLNFIGHTGYISSVTFSPDGQTIVSGSTDNTIRLWQAATGKPVKTITGHTDYISSLTYTPDGKILASGSGDSKILFWDVTKEDIKQVKSLKGHTGGIYTLLFNPDGSMLLSVGVDGTVRVWDVSTGKQKYMLSGRKYTNWGVTFTPYGRILACDSDHFLVRIWDVTTGERIQTFINESVNYSLAFSPDGMTLACGNSSNAVILWDLSPIVNTSVEAK